ncbi:hypothetical protein ACFQZI_05680 [Mucilaginibacter lutimaris]|uniref:VWFA domain-containing protein n=1 Tax=Mucilaginibacter lutimaris TaxID=931629 RepID=A0ABW2ZDS3_9SPHI
MSIFDDIGKAFEDLFDYITEGARTVVNTIKDGIITIEMGVYKAFIAISDLAQDVAHAIEDVGITISQGVIDGATTAINFLEKNAKEVIDTIVIAFDGDKGSQPTPEYKLAISKAVASVFLKIAVEGQEYDVFGILATGCNEKKRDLIKLGANITAERVGNDIYNIPRVAPAVVRKEALKEYIAWLILKAATDKPQMMENGKAGQVATGIIITAITTLLTEGKIANGAPAWPDIKGVTPDAIDPEATTVWTEGSRISVGDAIYLILDGQVRHIPDPETYKNLFDTWDGVIKSEEGLQKIGRPLTAGAYLSKADGDRVYLVVDGVKRWIASPQVFKKYHFNDKAIKHISPAQQNAIPTGDGIYQFLKKEGSTLNIKGGVYIIIDKKAHLIPNPETYNQLFKNWNGIQEVNSNSVLIGEPITDRAYLASATERVYFVSNGVKRWIMSPIAFNNFNFSWDKIRKVSAAELDRIPEGNQIF